MTDVLSAAPEPPGAGAVPGKVFRSELNPVDFLERAAYIYPDKTAVVHGERRYSYRQLADRSWRLANALRSAGLGKGDRVATLMVNSPAMLEAHFGVPAAGGILVAVNHRLASAEVGYILAHSGARFLLLHTALEALAGPLDLPGVTVIRCADTGDPLDPYEQFRAGSGGAASWSLVSVARYGPASSGGSAASKMDSAWPNFIAPPLSSPRTRKICSAVRCCISVATSSAGRPPRRFPRPSAVRPASPTGRVASLAVRVKARRGRSLTFPLSVSLQDECHHPSWVIHLRPLCAAGPGRDA